MDEKASPKVVNCHHFGGPDKLPKNAIYIGRPGPYGNPYSSKSGQWTREECVALHRVEVYTQIVQGRKSLHQYTHELGGKDLACWCTHSKKVIACHGDNYLHILSTDVSRRSERQSVLTHLMHDLRLVMDRLSHRIQKEISHEEYLPLNIHWGDLRIEVEYVLFLVKKNQVDADALCNFIAIVVIDLELGLREPKASFIHYHIDHAIWQIYRFIANRSDRDHEPIPPALPLKRAVPKVTSP